MALLELARDDIPQRLALCAGKELTHWTEGGLPKGWIIRPKGWVAVATRLTTHDLRLPADSASAWKRQR